MTLICVPNKHDLLVAQLSHKIISREEGFFDLKYEPFQVFKHLPLNTRQPLLSFYFHRIHPLLIQIHTQYAARDISEEIL